MQLNERSAGKARAVRSESTAEVLTANVSINTMIVTTTAAQGPADTEATRRDGQIILRVMRRDGLMDTEATGRDGQMNETKSKEGEQAVQILAERSKKLQEQTGNVYHKIQRLE